MRSACVLGSVLSILLAGGTARAWQDKTPTKATTDPAVCKTLAARPALQGDQFRAQDVNNDGKISRAEFKGRSEGFAWVDTDHDGFITRPEATRAFLTIVGGIALKEKAQAFKAMDSNKDGKLSASEFKGPKATFAAIDVNHDGLITPAEGLRALQVKVGIETIVARLRAMDVNHDGRIAAAEFKGPKAVFTKVDTDKNGYLSPGEIGKALKARVAEAASAPVKTAAVAPVATRVVKPVATKTGPARAGEPRWVLRLKAMDADKDGRVSKAEYLKAVEARFALIDQDKDGSITREDVVKLIAARQAKESPTAPVAKPVKAAKAPGAVRLTPMQRFNALDVNKDGKVTRAEFRGRPALFDRLDANGDGMVTRAEVQAAMAKTPKPVTRASAVKKG